MKKKYLLPVVLGVVAVATVAAATQPAGQKKTHLGDRVRSLVSFYASVGADSTEPLQRIGPDGQLIADYTLPEKTVLVVTDMLVSRNTSTNIQARAGLINRSGTGVMSPHIAFYTSNSSTNQKSVHLTSGAVWSEMPLACASDTSASVDIRVYGYLVRDR